MQTLCFKFLVINDSTTWRKNLKCNIRGDSRAILQSNDMIKLTAVKDPPQEKL